MLQALILICAMAIPSSDCSRSNAITVLVMPEKTALTPGCLISGGEYLANARLELGANYHATVRCERVRG